MANPAWQTVGVTVSGSSDSVTITAPSGIANNDILIALVYGEPHTQVITPASGFTSFARIQNATYPFVVEAFWKRAASESGNYTFTETGNTWGSGKIHRISGAILSGSPIDVTAVTNSGNSTSAQGNTITPVSDECLIVFVRYDGDGFTGTTPTGMTERVDANGQQWCDEPQTVATATGTRTATQSTSGPWITIMFAIKPEPGAGGQPYVIRGGGTPGMNRIGRPGW